MRDLITGLLELARGDANQARVEPCTSTSSSRAAVERARNRFPNVRRSVPTSSRRRSRVHRSGSSARLEPARERRQVERARRRRSRSRSRTASSACATTAPGSPPRIASTSSTVSIAHVGALATRLRARPRDRAGGRGSARRQRLRRGRARRRRAAPPAARELLDAAHLPLRGASSPLGSMECASSKPSLAAVPPSPVLASPLERAPGLPPFTGAATEEAAALGKLRLRLVVQSSTLRAPTGRPPRSSAGTDDHRERVRFRVLARLERRRTGPRRRGRLDVRRRLAAPSARKRDGRRNEAAARCEPLRERDDQERARHQQRRSPAS